MKNEEEDYAVYNYKLIAIFRKMNRTASTKLFYSKKAIKYKF